MSQNLERQTFENLASGSQPSILIDIRPLLLLKMDICTFRQKKLFGSFTTTAFYQIQNNCIMLHYFAKNTKVEHYYCLEDLVVKRMLGDAQMLIDAKKGIQIELQARPESDSQASDTHPDDIFLDFESSGYKVYLEDSVLEQNSFSRDGTLRYFAE
ncbi:Hypothetical_protein [Hexamita inflata]|uniref:Hypothetical_protein n=2 Tax=Hexamita inflata TaxID=28002 RepID=A0AA86P2E4_9EUKA|nr:Hypothetical protein HINF_LOCUS16552 [Hexamita inflata]